jgi:uncharacterized phage protein (TIGR01671 family)
MEYKPKTVEIRLTKEEFEKLKAVRQLDRVVFLDESSKECFTVYNLASDNLTEKGKTMKDEYLFKAKRTDNGEWVQGAFLCYNNTASIFNIEDGFLQEFSVDPDTICQCTGLKDKNGELIWENDIVVCRDFTEEKYVIAWKQDEACFECQQYSCSIMNFEQLSGCEIEVIGNIFDNKELLESEG